jgi:hypothetical protein
VCSECADLALIAAADAAGERMLALAWDGAVSLTSNERIPCRHTGPRMPDAVPGATVRERGRMFTLAGGLDDLWAKYDGRH